MAYSKDTEDKDWEEAQKNYEERKFDECERILKRLAKKSDSPSWYTYVLASLQIERNNLDEGSVTLDKSIEINPNWSHPHTLKAQINQRLGKNDLQSLRMALSEIELAINLFAAENSTEETITNNPDDFPAWLDNYINTSSGMYSLKNSIENEIKSTEVLYSIDNLENKIEQERFRNIEVIGVFSAIIALILSTAQSATSSIKGIDFIWLSIGLVIPIGFLILLVSPNRAIKTRAIIILGLLVLAGGIVGFFVNEWIN